MFKSFSELLKENMSLMLGYIFDASLGTAVIGAEPRYQLIGDLLEQYETTQYQYNPKTKEFKIKFEFMPNMYMINNNDMLTGYFLTYVNGFKLNGKECKCGEKQKVHIYPKEYFEGYSLCKKNNYSVHHCFGSWRGVTEKKEKEGKWYGYLKSNYFLRLLKDKYERRKRKNLPFQRYFIK